MIIDAKTFDLNTIKLSRGNGKSSQFFKIIEAYYISLETGKPVEVDFEMAKVKVG